MTIFRYGYAAYSNDQSAVTPGASSNVPSITPLNIDQPNSFDLSIALASDLFRSDCIRVKMNSVLQQSWLVTASSGVSLDVNYLDSATTVVTLPSSVTSPLSGTIAVSVSGLRNPKTLGSQLVTLDIEVLRMGMMLMKWSHSSQVVFTGPVNMFTYSGTPWSPASIARSTY